ncbi:MAG: flagellar biosynthetic protein FliO [Planctomycetaceae bacterium]|nr:flagellar biosynthetic protein FliO [Planctomycetaceae bacterium]
MSILLRSLLSFGIVLLVADLLCAQTVPFPVPPRQENAQLEAFRTGFSNSGVTHPLSTQSATQNVQFPEYLPPPNSVSQTSYTAQPFSSWGAPERGSPESQDDPYYDEDDEYVGVHHAVLERTLGRRSMEFGDEENKTETGGWKNPLSMPNFTPIISVGSTLLIVIAAFFILALFLRKVTPQSNRALPKDAFECLGRYYLTQKHQVQLLRLGSRIVLVSVMPDGVSTLAEIVDPDEAVSLLGLCRRLDSNSATEMFRKTVASMSEEELSRPSRRPVVATGRGRQSSGSLDLYSEPDESLAAILARGRQYR